MNIIWALARSPSYILIVHREDSVDLVSRYGRRGFCTSELVERCLQGEA